MTWRNWMEVSEKWFERRSENEKAIRCRKPKAAMASGLETNKASTYPDF